MWLINITVLNFEDLGTFGSCVRIHIDEMFELDGI